MQWGMPRSQEERQILHGATDVRSSSVLDLRDESPLFVVRVGALKVGVSPVTLDRSSRPKAQCRQLARGAN
jgi:hypothetical protein